MRIGKPLLVITTIAGLAIGIYEAFYLAGALGILVVTLIALFGAAMTWLFRIARAEERQRAGPAPGKDAGQD